MKSVTLFVITALAVVHSMSIGDIKMPSTVNKDLLQTIKSLFCTGKDMRKKICDLVLKILL